MCGRRAIGAESPIRLVQVSGGTDTLSAVTEYVEGSSQEFDLEARPPPGETPEAVGSETDCVVTEYELGGTDGVSVLESVRAEYPSLPVVVVTADRRPAAATEAVRAGADAHLTAETLERTPAKFRNRVVTAVEQYRSQQQSRHQSQVAELLARIDKRLIHADSRAEIERAVCEEVSATDPYPFAWIGTSLEDDVVRPRASAGLAEGYLEEITVRADGSKRGDGPAGAALQTGEVVVSHDVQEDVAFDPWSEQALERGFQSAAAVPLQYVDEEYGVLVLYADRPYAFEGREASLLERLGTDISRAIYESVLQGDLWEFRQMVEEAGEAMFATDGHGEVTYANPAFERLAGEGDSIDGERLEDIDLEVASEETAHRLSQTIQEGNSWEGELQLERATAEDRTVDLTARPLSNGATDGYVGVGTDVTEQRRYRNRIEQQRNRLELLNRILRHDIRNDVQVLLSMAGILETVVDEDDAEYVERITEKSQHIVELTRSARELTGAITDPGAAATERTNLDTVLGREIADVQRSHDADVTQDDRPANLSVQADEMLSSVFRNLLQNAAEHSESASVSVNVTTEVDDEHVRVRIADDGPGIPDDRKANVFEYMEKGETSAGTGIGLFLVEMLVDHYGGDVRVEDNDPEGTAFVVELQRA